MENIFDSCWLQKLNTKTGYPSNPTEAAELELQELFREMGIKDSYRIKADGAGAHYTISKSDDGYSVEGGEAGVLYGAFRLIFLIRRGEVEKTFRTAGKITEKPAFAYRIINHWDRIDGTVERGYSGRSLFFDGGEIKFSTERIRHYARMLASVGINAVSVNNVNVNEGAVWLITERHLDRLAELAGIFRSYGIRLILAVNYASPVIISKMPTADPRDLSVLEWWKNRMDLIYSYIPDLLGVIVKADSEHQPGPFTYGADHADGANLLAEAIAPHKGLVFWRCFVYNCSQDWRDTKTDRPKAAYETYQPLDGRFKENVVLQVKNGPYDFQVREPVSPLLGAMEHTAQALEFQLAQEYTGHQIDLYYMPEVWREVFDFDTGLQQNGKISDFAGGKIGSIAAVSNTGNDENWTGHCLAQANLFAYGRIAWNPLLTPQDLADEWCGLTFAKEQARRSVSEMLLASRSIYESYTTPLGMCWFVVPHLHYGPDPMGYEFSKWGTYHRADRNAIGIDRSTRGTGFTAQYAGTAAQLYDSIDTCPEELLLFFHRLPYEHLLKSGKTLAQTLYDFHFDGADGAEKLLEKWKSLTGLVPDDVYGNVLKRLERQLLNAREWRDVFNTTIYRLSGIPDSRGRLIYS